MPRPQLCRKICNMPEFSEFAPDNCKTENTVVLTIDEFEVIRLVDLEEQTHEQCARQMEVSRTTVTDIYKSARQKLADCLVNGKRLEISGGNYRLCNGLSKACYKRNCEKQKKFKNIVKAVKGENIMRIAVTYENGMVFQHFGHSAQFKFYDADEKGTIVDAKVVNTNGSGHGALAGFLAQNNVDILICGGIGAGAQTALAEAGIKLYGGVKGNADQAVLSLLSNTLEFNPDVRCDHHDHEHGNGEHTCGEHGCKNH